MKQFLQLIRPFREMRKMAFFSFVLFALLAIPMGMWGQVESGTTYETKSVNSLPDGWSGNDGAGTAYIKLIASDHYIQTSEFGQNGFTSIKLKARKYGGPTEAQALITVSWYENDEETVLGTIAPTSTTLTDYTISSVNNPTGNTTGYIKIQCKGAGSSKGSGVSEVTITYTAAGSTPQPTTYTVTYDCNGGTSGCPENVTGLEAGSAINLAGAPSKTDYDFSGWSDGNTTYDAGAAYTVNGNVTFTAQWTEQVSGDVHWVLTDLASLTTEDVFVIVGDNGSKFAMKNDNGTSSAPATVAVTVSGNEITGTVAPNIRWNVSGNATDGYTFYPNGSTSTWLYCNTTAESSSNNNMRVGTGDRKVFEMNSSNFLMTKDDYVVRYLSIYNDQDWRGYINTNLCPEISFYKKFTGEVLPPSITAENVNIEYDAESGEIEYTINNGVEGGSLAAATESDWLTIGTVGETVPFTCTANTDGTPRTAVVTLTYTYGDSQTATANVTVSQAGNPNAVDNISDITAAGTYAVKGTIVAKSTRGFIVGDGTGYVYYYNANYTQNDYNIGDIVKLSGSVVAYGGVYEFNSSTTITSAETSNYVAEEPIALTGADMDARVASNETSLSTYVQYQGTLTISGNYYNITNIDGATTAKGSISSPLNTDFASLDGSVVVVEGYFVGVSSSQYYNTMIGSITEVVSEEPVITVADATVNAPYTGADGTLAVTYDNLTITDMTDFDIQYYDAAGIEVEEPEWVEVVVAEQDPEVGEGYVVSYYVMENEGEARTAYFKVYALDEESELVYSNLVTISQDANPAIAAITIAEVRAQQTGDVLTMGIVTSCVGTTGYIQDATAAICVYGTALTVGDSVLVSGTLSTYKGLLEITNPEVTVLANDKTVEPTVMTIADINSDNAGDNAWQGWLVTIENAKVTDISDQNTTVEQAGATIVVRGISSDVIYAENDMLTLTGNIGCFNVAQIVNPTNVMVQPSLDPSITVTPTTISVDASEHDGMLTVTYENMETVSDVAIVWYESDGETSASSSDWLLAEINGNTIEYLIFANNGEARSAYFKVYAATAGVYSDLVTVTQSAPLVTASFTKVSSLSAVQSGKKYILVCPSAVQGELPAPTAATSTVSNSALQAVNVAIGDDGIISTPLNGDGYPCTITFEATEDGYYIQIGEKYLNNTSSTSISLSNNGSSVWVPDLYNGEVILKNSSNNNRFLGGATSEAMTYKAYATSNMGSYPMVVLYQEQESVECGPIALDEGNNYIWDEDFENMTTSTKLFTGVPPQCWTVAHEYTSPSINHIGLEQDTLPQLYRSFNHTTGGHYSLRMKYRALLAMPELDEDVDLSRLRMSLYVRQPQTYYKLQIGVMSDLDDESTFVPVATVNNASKNMEEFVCDFSGYTGGGRYIAFKNVGGSASDPYCSNYLDDITLTYMEEAGCTIPVPYTENFEGFTTSSGASGVEPDCWEVIREDVALDVTTKPQVYAGFNTTEGGHYSLRMKNRCVYAMPEFAEDVDVKELTLSFSLRQAKSFYRLEVGVVDAAGNFVAVEEINNPGTNIERDVTVDFSTLEGEGTGKRIAFHNILRNSAKYDYSYNYIDDINLYYTSAGAEGDKTMEFAGSDEMNADHYLDNIAVYPNPTTGMLQIDAVDVQKVECYSQMGQLVGVYDNVNELNIGNLAKGVYTLRITVPQGVTMRKVVKR